MSICLDTWALVEMHDGRLTVESLHDDDVVIPDLLAAEFYWVLLRVHGAATAEFWRRKLEPLNVQVPRALLFAAMRYRFEHKKERVSFFDCVGYMYAREHKMHFVTGDKAFKGKSGVKFIG